MTKKAAVKTGDTVAWKWGSGQGEGKVTAVHKATVEKTIKGSKVKRNASAAKPAVEVKTDKGGKVLKSTSEVTVRS